MIYKKTTDHDFRGEAAAENHITFELIDYTCKLELEDAPPVFYLQETHPALEGLPDIINEISFNASNRSANQGEDSILFGAVSKQITKSGFCTQGALMSKNRDLDEMLCSKFAYAFDSLLMEKLPPRHRVSSIKVEGQSILPEYRMGDTVFTSGVINRNSAFRYHYDGFNLKNTYTLMVVFRKNASGGHLVFPEYGIGFKLDSQAIIMFYGKGILHGVTPIQKHADDAYRISVVYYASENLGKCKTFEEELAEAQSKEI